MMDLNLYIGCECHEYHVLGMQIEIKIATALTTSAVDFEDYSPSFQSGSNTCICIIHRSSD